MQVTASALGLHWGAKYSLPLTDLQELVSFRPLYFSSFACAPKVQSPSALLAARLALGHVLMATATTLSTIAPGERHMYAQGGRGKFGELIIGKALHTLYCLQLP